MRSWNIPFSKGDKVIHRLSTVPPTVIEAEVVDTGYNYLTLQTGGPINARYRLYEAEVDTLEKVNAS